MTTTLLNPSRSFVERTAIQRREALRVANRVRSRRAALKRDLKAGRCSAVALIAADPPPDWLASMKLIDVLLAQPKIGHIKAAKMLKQTGVSPHKTLAGLSARQRVELIHALGCNGTGGGEGEGWR